MGNNLFKRFQAQHRDKLGEPEGDLLYDGFDTVKSRRERTSRERMTRTRSRSRDRKDRRSRKRSASSSNDSSRSSSSSEDSDAKKKKESSKKKKDKESSSDSEEEKKDEGGSDWRVELLKKMKDIKNLPPEELEAEFKKAMDEKRKKEQC